MQNYLDHKLQEGTLFQTKFEDGGYVVWRPLSWSEYKKYREARSTIGPRIDIQIEESVYERSVVFSTYDTPPPEELSEIEAQQWLFDCRLDQPAGIIPTVVKTVMFISGAKSGRDIMTQLDQHRPYATNIEDQLVALVCKAFPAYKPEEVEGLPWQTLLKRVAQAELLLGTSISLVDHEEEARKAAAAQRFDLQKDIKEVTAGMRKIDGVDPQQAARETAEASRERQEQMGELRRQYLAKKGM